MTKRKRDSLTIELTIFTQRIKKCRTAEESTIGPVFIAFINSFNYGDYTW